MRTVFLSTWALAALGLILVGLAQPVAASTGCKCDLQYYYSVGVAPPILQCNAGSCPTSASCLQGGDWATYYVCICADASGTPITGLDYCSTYATYDPALGVWTTACKSDDCPTGLTCLPGKSQCAGAGPLWQECQCK